jgi:hypothetical protein
MAVTAAPKASVCLKGDGGSNGNSINRCVERLSQVDKPLFLMARSILVHSVMTGFLASILSSCDSQKGAGNLGPPKGETLSFAVDEIWSSVVYPGQRRHRVLGLAHYRKLYYYWESTNSNDSARSYIARGRYVDFDDRIELSHPFGDPMIFYKVTRMETRCLVLTPPGFNGALDNGWVMVARPQADAENPFTWKESALDNYYTKKYDPVRPQR